VAFARFIAEHNKLTQARADDQKVIVEVPQAIENDTNAITDLRGKNVELL
jgi:hypothetical protein